MLTLSLPPEKTKLRIISDSKVPYKIQGLSTWVSMKPYLDYRTTLNNLGGSSCADFLILL